MLSLNGLFIDGSVGEINKIKNVFNKNKINVKPERVNSEEKFMNTLIEGKYDIVISNYPNKSLNFLTLLGLYEIHGRNIPVIVLMVEEMEENTDKSNCSLGKIIFIDKNNIESCVSRVKNLLKLVC